MVGLGFEPWLYSMRSTGVPWLFRTGNNTLYSQTFPIYASPTLYRNVRHHFGNGKTITAISTKWVFFTVPPELRQWLHATTKHERQQSLEVGRQGVQMSGAEKKEIRFCYQFTCVHSFNCRCSFLCWILVGGWLVFESGWARIVWHNYECWLNTENCCLRAGRRQGK